MGLAYVTIPSAPSSSRTLNPCCRTVARNCPLRRSCCTVRPLALAAAAFLGMCSQVPGTVGRTLLDTGRYVHEGTDVKPRMKVEFMDLSAHCGKNGLIDFIKKTKPKKTFLVHGERTTEFASQLNKEGIDAIAPKNGDSFKF